MITTITHACGHKEEVAVYGKRADRERKIAWLESQLCDECWAREKAEQSAAKGWAALEGSPKQIAWAEDLRSKTMDAISVLKTRTDDEAARKARVIAYLGGTTAGAVWIDTRVSAGKGMVRRAFEHAAENGIDLTDEPADETVEEPVEEAETDETAETAETTEPSVPAKEPVEETVAKADDNYLTVDDLFALSGLTVEDLFNPEPPKPMTEEEKKQAEEEKAQYEFERDVSTYVVLMGFLDDRADSRTEQFRHDVVQTKGEDYWKKVVAAGEDRRNKLIAAALE